MSTSVAKRPRHRPFGLFTLFPPGRIFMDADRDRIPDRVGLFIGVSPGLDDPEVWAAILNLSARVAAEVVAWQRPFVGPLAAAPSSGPCLLVYPPSRRHAAAVEVLRLAAERFAVRGQSPGALAALLNTLAVSNAPPALKVAGWVALRSDRDRSDRIQAFDPKGRLAGVLSLAPPVALLPVIRPAPAGGDLLDPDCTFYHSPAGAPMRKQLLLAVDLPRAPVPAPLGVALSELVARLGLAATEIEVPLAAVGRPEAGGVTLRVAPGGSPIARIRPAETPGSPGISLIIEGPPAPLARLLRRYLEVAFPDGSADGKAVRFRSDVDAALACVHHAQGGGPRADGEEEQPAFNFRHRWRSETRRVADCLHGLARGTGPLEGLILVSKPKSARRALTAEAAALLRAKGYRPRLSVLNAYKPGLSWLLEVVLPQIKRGPAPVRLEVAYRPFAPGDGALEMESRWLQEIYPGPDLLAAALGLAVGDVRLVKRGKLRDAYRVRAWDRRRRLVFETAFTPRVTAFDYLPGRPEEGKVHPAAGGIRLSASGRVVLDADIPTDREVFWRHFQTHWLPSLESAMRARADVARAGMLTAFWEEVRFDVAIEESDLRLGLGAERVAPMEALHEDLYFGLLDFFRVFAREHGLPESVAFGRILPRVSAKAARGGPTVRWQARPFTAGATAAGLSAGKRPPVTSIEWEKGRWRLGFGSPGPIAAVLRSKSPRPRHDAAAFTRVPKPAPPPLNRRLTAVAVNDWIRRLGRQPPVNAWQAGVSWQGRPIQAVEVALPTGDLRSVARLRLVKPTLLLNARHHANE
ncbi:MAG: hypothetical protein EHM15_02140, partial [Desulfobacteraceae bacterium]